MRGSLTGIFRVTVPRGDRGTDEYSRGQPVFGQSPLLHLRITRLLVTTTQPFGGECVSAGWREQIMEAVSDFEVVSELARNPTTFTGYSVEFRPAPHRPVCLWE